MLHAEQDNRWFDQSSERSCRYEGTQRNKQYCMYNTFWFQQALTFSNCTLCLHSVFFCFIFKIVRQKSYFGYKLYLIFGNILKYFVLD
jgi:hypothetical protein